MAEGIDSVRRNADRDPVVILQNGLPEKSTGRKFVDGIASAASFAQTKVAEGMATINDRWHASRKSL